MNYYNEEFKFVQNVMQNSSASPPKFMLVFINVLSGQGAAINVFIQSAMPYFAFANIKYDIVAVTSPSSGLPLKPEILQRELGCASLLVLSGRISDFIQSMDTADMEKYDAFVVVGGDGTFGELATGCTLFAQRALDDASKYPSIFADSELRPFIKPIGIIPAGSTDAVACTLFGSRDPNIASICIALGMTCFMDIQAVFADGHFAKISLAAVACGFLTETLVRVKKFARLGHLKSLVAGIGAFLSFRPYNIAVEYRPRDISRVSSQHTCTYLYALLIYLSISFVTFSVFIRKCSCSVCEEWVKLNSVLPKNSSLSSKCEWRWAPMEPGPIAAVNAYASPIRLPFALTHGLAPLCHLSDATAHVFVIPHSAGRLKLLTSLLASVFGCIGAVYYQKSSIVKVTAIRSCCEYRFTVKLPDQSESLEGGIAPSVSWNVDGEIIAANSLHSVVHSRLLKFFGTGGPLPSPPLLSYLFYYRCAKLLMPGVVLRPSPFQKKCIVSRVMSYLDDSWRGSWLDAALAPYLTAKWHVSSSSAGRLIVVCSGFVILIIILLMFYMLPFHSDPHADLDSFEAHSTVRQIRETLRRNYDQRSSSY